MSTHRREAVRVRTHCDYNGGPEGGNGRGKPKVEKETEGTQQKIKQMSAWRPCCVGFICVLVYLVGGAAATAADATAVGHRLLLWQSLCHFLRRRPDGVAVQRFCWSVKRHVSESVVGRVHGCGPRAGKASMCQDYCEISR